MEISRWVFWLILFILIIRIPMEILIVLTFEPDLYNEERCDNGVYELRKNTNNCPPDCASTCGNGVCEAGENCSNCSIDCGPCGPTCGNGVCEPGENLLNCPIDCISSKMLMFYSALTLIITDIIILTILILKRLSLNR